MFFLLVAYSASFYTFFFNDTATTEIYTLSLYDALPISEVWLVFTCTPPKGVSTRTSLSSRSEEHTSELQSHSDLVCRLLLEKKKGAYFLGIGAQGDGGVGIGFSRQQIGFERDEFFFFNDTATTEIYTLSLHDALPI